MKRAVIVTISVLLFVLCGCGEKGKKEPDVIQSVVEETKDPLEEKHPEYFSIRKTATRLNCSNEEEGEEIELLYTSDQKLVVGVYGKVTTGDLDNPEAKKAELEEVFSKEYNYEYFDIQVVDHHLEFEYISTDIPSFSKIGLIYSLEFEKDYRESYGSGCRVEIGH